MAMDKQVLRKITKLARLNVAGENREQYAVQTAKIVALFDRISELDTQTVAPLLNVHDMTTPLAADTEKAVLSQDQLLSNAPDIQASYIKVPIVIDRSVK
jgi:aspartyl/glutamyl-tRNA(Asn/Gln) amidotransferase C subunit